MSKVRWVALVFGVGFIGVALSLLIWGIHRGVHPDGRPRCVVCAKLATRIDTGEATANESPHSAAPFQGRPQPIWLCDRCERPERLYWSRTRGGVKDTYPTINGAWSKTDEEAYWFSILGFGAFSGLGMLFTTGALVGRRPKRRSAGPS